MSEVTFPQANILIVDDEPVNVMLLEQILQRQSYANWRSTTEPKEVLPLVCQDEPDLILLDLMMPGLDGFAVMEQINRVLSEKNYLPILILTADFSPQTRLKALASGATDFLTKPFDPNEVALRIKNLLTTRHLHVQLREQNRVLEDKVQERTADLAEAQEEILHRLALAAEFRDDDTGQHTHRVASMVADIATEMGFSPDRVELIRKAAPLHDVGKIGISDMVLLKPGKLTDEEFATIKTHALLGAQMLSGGRSDLVQMAEVIAMSHHERWDGRGYPRGLEGEDIPLEGRIVAIADVFDALTHERPYKKAWPREEAIAEIKAQSGRQFDPAIVEAFLRVEQKNEATAA